MERIRISSLAQIEINLRFNFAPSLSSFNIKNTFFLRELDIDVEYRVVQLEI